MSLSPQQYVLWKPTPHERFNFALAVVCGLSRMLFADRHTKKKKSVVSSEMVAHQG